MSQPQEVSGRWEGNNDAYGGGNRQPNFLQKLYDFLAIEPHPCPEVIYWASDSRQLVIAQPERLVREVLPKLFKHDKLSSFGRQLNIYGFSRLFPGRQFKDANGEISDASVWAHPTLHRLSTSVEISSVKRRAAPKLFRTRRLANGQVVRSRAGPAVEAKAREIRESIAESRRHRGTLTAAVPSTPVNGDLGITFGQHRGSFEDSLTLRDETSLPNIAENFVSHDVSPIHGAEEEGRRASMLSAGTIFQQSPTFMLPTLQDRTNLQYHQGQGQGELQTPQEESTVPRLMPLDTRAFQSCPASIHTSPASEQTPWGFAQANIANAQWSSSFSQFSQDLFSPATQNSTNPVRQLVPMGTPSTTPKIAHPAAVNPFLNAPKDQDNGVGLSHASWSSALGPPQTPPNSAAKELEHSFSGGNWGDNASWKDDQGHPSHLQPSWEGINPIGHKLPPTTIDPRWVSPISSLWNTPAGTRAPSPSHTEQTGDHFQPPHNPNKDYYPAPSHSSLDIGVEPLHTHTQVLSAARGTQSYPPRISDRRHFAAPTNLLLQDGQVQPYAQGTQQYSTGPAETTQYSNTRPQTDLVHRHVRFDHIPDFHEERGMVSGNHTSQSYQMPLTHDTGFAEAQWAGSR